MKFAGAVLCLALAGCSHSAETADGAAPAKAGAELAPPSANTTATAKPGGASSAPTRAKHGSAPDGAAIFAATCATCHMANGGGVPYMQPSIKGSGWISAEDPQLLVSLILRGSKVLGEGAQAYENDMAPQDHLSDAEIAAVATYVRQRFAATPITKPVTPDEVAVARNRPGLP